jgi:hypothetical protein
MKRLSSLTAKRVCGGLLLVCTKTPTQALRIAGSESNSFSGFVRGAAAKQKATKASHASDTFARIVLPPFHFRNLIALWLIAAKIFTNFAAKVH